MKKLFPTRDSIANLVTYYHLMLLMASLPFDLFYSHVILISLCLHTMIHYNKNDTKPISKTPILVLQSVFIITAVSTIYSINHHEAFIEWGRQVTILIFPLVICFNPIDLNKYRSQLLLSFSLVCTITVVYLYLDVLKTIRYYGLPFSAILSTAFTNHNFALPIAIHATFFSMQLAIALVFLLSRLLKSQKPYTKLIYGCCIAVLSMGLIQLSSKSVLIPLLIIVIIAVPYFMLKGSKRIKYILMTSISCALATLGIFSITTFRNRFITDLKNDLSLKVTNVTTDSRLDRWNTAAELIAKKPLIGYGAGSEIELLHERFYEKRYYSSFLNRLNSHNQYLSFLLKSGIAGLLVYLGTLLYGYKIAIKKRDLLLFSFLTIVVFVSVSENFLDVDKGVFYYALFFSFFMFSEANAQQPVKTLRKTKYLDTAATTELVTSS